MCLFYEENMNCMSIKIIRTIANLIFIFEVGNFCLHLCALILLF